MPNAKLTALLLVAALQPACFAITDLDRFKEKTEVVSATGNRHLKLHLRGFSSHVTGFFEFQVVDANNFLSLRGVADPMGSANGDTTFVVPNGFPPPSKGPFRITILGDKNANRKFDGPGNPDHSWQITNITGDNLAGANPDDATWEIEQIHDQRWQDFEPTIRDTGIPGKVKLTGLEDYLGENNGPGRTIEVRIADAASDNSVGFWRVEHIVQPAFDIELPGIADDKVNYNVYVWIDANGNGVYDNPARGGDHGWKLPVTAFATGFELPFDAKKSTDRSTDLGVRP